MTTPEPNEVVSEPNEVVSEPNEVVSHQYQLAQANRLIRYCLEQGVDASKVMAGKIDLDLAPICGEDGEIAPDVVDYEQVQRPEGN